MIRHRVLMLVVLALVCSVLLVVCLNTTQSVNLTPIVQPDIAARTTRIEYNARGDAVPFSVSSGDVAFKQAIRKLTTPFPTRPGPPPPHPLATLTLFDSADVSLCTVELFYECFTVNGLSVTPRDDGNDLRQLFSRMHSDLVYKYSDGSRKATGIHNKGRRDGDWIFYYRTGEVEWTGSYKMGQKSGVWHRYDKSGNIAETYSFEDFQCR